jgi:hypothetical protein
MTTSDLIDELVTRFNGWSRDGDHGVLRYLNAAHGQLMAMEAEQNLIVDTVTGGLPVLNTTAGTFIYTMPTNVWRVTGILIKLDDGTIPSLKDYGIYNIQIMQRPLRTTMKNARSIGGRFYAKYAYARCKDYVNSTNLATVMFTRDPETKTDFYYRQSFRRPTDILSETIQPDIPPPYDFEILLPAATKLIEGVQSGNYMEAYEYVKKVFKPALWKELNAGDQGEYDAEPVNRGF